MFFSLYITYSIGILTTNFWNYRCTKKFPD
nr:MAG TPA: hypothetical protein [Crassvirales sp.]